MTAINYFLKRYHNDQIIPYALNLPIITIGTALETSITLPSGACDDRHCRIEQKNPHQFVIRDLRSSSGTFVNGTRILEAILYPGDRIQINDTYLEFTNDAQPPSRISPLFFKSHNTTWKNTLKSIPFLARSPFPVLILGPSGSGKELTAQAIHDHSARCYGPFITVNCSALAENLIESELFGHVKGSFTGAISDRKGAFETARGGTLFLDEIGDLPYSLQAKLLRTLENNEIRPVGSDRVLKMDVRIIAATHQNLYQKMAQKTFRSDLFYRLNVISIQTLSLSSRMEDFEDIFFTLCKEARVRFSFQAIQFLKGHHWPGNIRELKNVVSRAAALYSGQTVEEPLVKGLIDNCLEIVESTKSGPTFSQSGVNVIKEMEKQMILHRLAANRGNQRRTALELGMPKSTLHDRIRTYAADLETFREEISKD